ncbi:hypothetical protein V6N13_134785 [Hibiscus sabdariffa]|uniref:Uncharacterized protein n=1 Tax=Hibiscus sabdariffa TaxID=183260 RepID=A0ABR2R4U0_9ROSI
MKQYGKRIWLALAITEARLAAAFFMGRVSYDDPDPTVIFVKFNKLFPHDVKLVDQPLENSSAFHFSENLGLKPAKHLHGNLSCITFFLHFHVVGLRDCTWPLAKYKVKIAPLCLYKWSLQKYDGPAGSQISTSCQWIL